MKYMILAVFLILASCGDGGGLGGQGTGVSGSTSRFAIVGDRLHVLNQSFVADEYGRKKGAVKSTIRTFSIESPSFPVSVADTELASFRPETLYASGDNLFVGTATGMEIYSLEDPDAPEFVSLASHFRARDPVVIENSRAYVTLRTSEDSFDSFGSVNELQVFDITDLKNPVRLAQVPMTFPWGLTVKNGFVYVCDGSAGLKVLSVKSEDDIKEVAKVDTDICFDLILAGQNLVTTGAGGLTQYQVDGDGGTVTQVSAIPVVGGQW